MQDPQMSQYGSAMMGFGAKDDTPGPNRAERRAMQQRAARQKRRGQRAYGRALKAVDNLSPDEAAAVLRGERR